jgi:hypothetical protein
MKRPFLSSPSRKTAMYVQSTSKRSHVSCFLYGLNGTGTASAPQESLVLTLLQLLGQE